MKTLNKLNDDQIEKLKQGIKKVKWYRQATGSKLSYIIVSSFGVVNYIPYDTVYCNGMGFEAYLSLNGMNKTAKDFFKLSKKSKKPVDDHYNKFFSIVTQIFNLCDRGENIDFEKADLGYVREFLKELNRLNYNMWNHGFLVDEFDPEGDKMLKQVFKDNNMKINHEESNHLIRPQELNFIEKSNMELLKVAKMFKEGMITDESQLLEELKPVADKFYYVQNSWGAVNVLTAKDFMQSVKDILYESGDRVDEMLDGYINLPKKAKKKYDEVSEKHKINDEVKNVVYMFTVLTKLRDERKCAVLRSNHFYDLITRRFASEFDVDLKLMYNAYANEFESINSRQDVERLMPLFEEREKGVAFGHVGTDEFFILEGTKAMNIIKLLKETLVADFEEIKGMIACLGDGKSITGNVKIILGETHFSKFNEGDILVTPMTRPEFVPLMKKAKAIITDEGGLTCHAAIISRELNKPCIIGTSVATKKLFDGKEVEMDMKTGVIKIK